MTADGGMVTESGDAQVTDVHDYSSTYGEFLGSGNDPSRGQRQLSVIRMFQRVLLRHLSVAHVF